MNDRVFRIISQVRQLLKQVSNDELKNKQIYTKANYIQDEILQETKCNEIEFIINTISGEESYDIQLENTDLIKTYETSWYGPLNYVVPVNWNSIGLTGGGYPTYFTLFEKKIKFRPIPNRTDDEIKIWAYQENVIVKMDDDIPPEIPQSADRCLIYGICSEFDPNFLQMYLDLRDKVAIKAHSKITTPKEGIPNW